MQQRLKISVLAVLLLAAACFLSLNLAPAGPWMGALPGARLTPLAGARLLDGRALVALDGDAFELLAWSWCPRRGVTSWCLNSRGAHGLVEAEVRPGWSGLIVRELRFSGLPVTALGVADWPAARLSGHLRDLQLAWGAPCAARALLRAAGDIELSGVPGADLALDLVADDAGTLLLRGDGVSGRLSGNATQLLGELQLELPGAASAMQIARRWRCAAHT